MRTEAGCTWRLALGVAAVAWLPACTTVSDSTSPWVVNAAVWGGRDEAWYVAGYVSNCDCGEHGFIKRFAGEDATTLHESEHGLWGIWGSSEGEIVAVGEQGTVVRVVDGHASSTRLEGAGQITLRDVWGVDDGSELFIVGGEGTAGQLEGDDWVPTSLHLNQDLRAVWGSSAQDVFAVGRDGVILHFDGTDWTHMNSGTAMDLNGVWGTGPDDVFAVGGSERDEAYTIRHFDGSRWSEVARGGPGHLNAITGTADGEMLAVGGHRKSDDEVDSLLVRLDGQEWREAPSRVPQFLWDVAVLPNGEFFTVGPDSVAEQGSLSP
jgi:hypothetical protein